MRTEWRSVPALETFRLGSRLREPIGMLPARMLEFSGRPSMLRVAAGAVVTVAIAMSGSMAPRWIASAQAGASFEVVSVPAQRPGNIMARISRTPERIAFQATQVGDLIAFAYGFPLDRVDRRPQFMYNEFYDVAVTTAAPASLPEQKLMLQKLLEERFSLVVHRISTPSPVYFLVPGAKVNLTETKEGDAVDSSGFCASNPRPQLQPGASGLSRVGFAPPSMCR